LPTRALARKPYRRSSIDSSHEYIVAPAINEFVSSWREKYVYISFISNYLCIYQWIQWASK